MQLHQIGVSRTRKVLKSTYAPYAPMHMGVFGKEHRRRQVVNA